MEQAVLVQRSHQAEVDPQVQMLAAEEARAHQQLEGQAPQGGVVRLVLLQPTASVAVSVALVAFQ